MISLVALRWTLEVIQLLYPSPGIWALLRSHSCSLISTPYNWLNVPWTGYSAIFWVSTRQSYSIWSISQVFEQAISTHWITCVFYCSRIHERISIFTIELVIKVAVTERVMIFKPVKSSVATTLWICLPPLICLNCLCLFWQCSSM